VEVSDMQLSAGPQDTRLAMDLSARTAHTLSILKNPDRIVLDIANAHFVAHGHAAPEGAGAVKDVRVGRRPAGGLRLVLDLSRPIHARSFIAEPCKQARCRLIVDLSGAAAAPLAVRAEHARPEARNLIIAIDAGHGGDDPGAIGKFGTQEKDVTLAIARLLAHQINEEPGMRAVLTRDGDYFVPLRDRMVRARAKQADLFVSIHADSVRDRSVDGSSVYILSQRGATDEAARWLAERENAADLIGGVSLDDKGDVLASVLLDLSQSAALSASETAAEHVLHQLVRVGEIRKPEVQQARFVVLKSPDIPSMLVETAYISNPQEELRLRGTPHQTKLAAAIHQGLRSYFYDDPPAGTRIAEIVGGASSPTPTRPVPAGSEPVAAPATSADVGEISSTLAPAPPPAAALAAASATK
jgi:N-acetylmuramoyl-L-alanine amidase